MLGTTRQPMLTASMPLVIVRRVRSPLHGSSERHMGPLEADLDGGQWADAPMNSGLSVRWDVRRNPNGARRRDPERLLPMRKRRWTSQVTVTVKLNVASILFGIAAIITALMR